VLFKASVCPTIQASRGPMSITRSPKASSISQDDLNWRKLYALCFAYLTIILVINWYKLRVHVAPISLPSVTKKGAGLLRPTLFERVPNVDTSRNAATVIDPSLLPLLNITQGVREHDRKNPCWLLEGELKCIPYFFVLGSFQGGIKDLEVKMLKHPDIVQASPPEPHFWSELKPAATYINQLSKAYRRHTNVDTSPRNAILG
jgi:hypothetical protein